MNRFVAILKVLLNSGIWAPLCAGSLFLLSVRLQSDALLAIAWIGMAIAPLYVGFFCGDAKSAIEKQSRVHANR
ncbi:hypothetical protein VDS42_18975 [Xanthomonas campestris pv. campestris]|nr:hypothetical protein [Xanthomonas campestris pv. campestris]